MNRCLTLALLFAWMFVAGCWPTKNPKNETRNDDLNTIAPKMTESTTEEVPPTSVIFRVQGSTVPSRKSTTAARAVPVQTDQEPTRESPLSFFTSDIKKLNILVMVLTSIVMLLASTLLILCVLRRNMQRKMRRMKEEKGEETTTTTDGATALCKETLSTESRFYNYATPQQPAVEYEVPYAHQQAMHVQIMALANPNPANNNVTNQIAPTGLPVTPTMDGDDSVNSRAFEAIVEDFKSADQTIDKQEYKIPRNATKSQAAGLMSNEALTNTSTLKDSRGYVVMLNYARPMEHQPKNSHSVLVEGHEQHVYDEPVKTGRSTNTFSRNTIKTKIKIFQEKLKSDKSKHAAPAENAEKGTRTQKDFIRESMVKNTAYDTPRKV